MAPLPGSRIGPYEVVGPLGAGGMGEVYRARDPRLQRDVAIKVLPSSFALDNDRLLRFEREARILASLDHRHIAAIYGVEEVDGHKALVLEFVDGLTLAERIDQGPLDLHEALTVARQIADAVESAHEQGIIHRDLKPANIKIRPDGAVKVLDFGLARADSSNSSAAETPTITAVATREGTTLGTAAYMSPEQARGRVVDRRTDIWAFGCILFEMLSGRRAFEADGTTDTIARVLQRDPEWAVLPAETPRAIRELVTRCLQKDQRQRLRDIGDARITIDETLAQPDRPDRVVARRTRSRPYAAIIAIALVTAAVTYAVTRFASPPPSDPAPLFDHLTRIVASSAHEFSPVISPDGKWVAYLSNARGVSDVWLKFIAGGDAVNLTANLGLSVQSEATIGGLEVSPDGSQLAFVAASPGAPAMTMSTFVVAAPLGGPARRLLQGSQGMHWSPDGKRILYIRPGGSFGDTLLIADQDGQNEREIVKHQGARHIHWPRWSADGEYVYFNYGYQNGNSEQTEIFRVAAAGGTPERVVATTRRAVFPLPGPDGRGLFFAANPDSVDLNLWWREFRGRGPEGMDKRVTFGIGEYASPSISADGRRLVATLSDLRQALKRVTIRFDGAALEPLTDGYTGDIDPCWSADGTHLVFSSSRAGYRNIWIANADLSKPVALTAGEAIDSTPVYSPDGHQVAFVSDRGGQRGIWIVNAEGGAPRLIAPAQVLHTLSWSRDGTRLAYSAPDGDLPQINIMEVGTGKVTHLPTGASATSPMWSPIEDVIAYVETTPGVGGFVRFITGDGRPLSRGPVDTVTRLNNGFVRWSPDGKRLAGVGVPGNQHSYIWIIDPLGPVPFRKLLDLPPDTYVRGASWAPDGSTLVIGDSRSAGDIVLAERVR